MNLGAEIIVLRVIPTPVVALERSELLKVFGNFVETGTLHTANGRVGDEKLVFVFVDQVFVDLARELCVIGGLG